MQFDRSRLTVGKSELSNSTNRESKRAPRENGKYRATIAFLVRDEKDLDSFHATTRFLQDVSRVGLCVSSSLPARLLSFGANAQSRFQGDIRLIAQSRRARRSL